MALPPPVTRPQAASLGQLLQRRRLLRLRRSGFCGVDLRAPALEDHLLLCWPHQRGSYAVQRVQLRVAHEYHPLQVQESEFDVVLEGLARTRGASLARGLRCQSDALEVLALPLRRRLVSQSRRSRSLANRLLCGRSGTQWRHTRKKHRAGRHSRRRRASSPRTAAAGRRCPPFTVAKDGKRDEAHPRGGSTSGEARRPRERPTRSSFRDTCYLSQTQTCLCRTTTQSFVRSYNIYCRSCTVRTSETRDHTLASHRFSRVHTRSTRLCFSAHIHTHAPHE